MLVHVRVTYNMKTAGTHLLGEKLCEKKVSCPKTQDNDLAARARTETAQSGDERSKHEATTKRSERAVNVSCFSFAGLEKITNLRRACVCHDVSCIHTILTFVERANFVPQDQLRLER